MFDCGLFSTITGQKRSTDIETIVSYNRYGLIRGSIETIVSYTILLLNFGEVMFGLSPPVLEGLSLTEGTAKGL